MARNRLSPAQRARVRMLRSKYQLSRKVLMIRFGVAEKAIIHALTELDPHGADRLPFALPMARRMPLGSADEVLRARYRWVAGC